MDHDDSLLAQPYDAAAADYERMRVPRFRPFVKKLLELYDTRPRSKVLDAGTGTGLAATMVAPRVGHDGRVVGVDVSEAMLAIARQKAKNFGFTQCDFRIGHIQALDFPDGTFDLVICSFVVAGTPPGLFTEFRRVLKPNGGALLFQDWAWTRTAPETAYERVFATYSLPEPPEPLPAMRAVIDRLRRDWQTLGSVEDYARAVTAAELHPAQARAVTFPVHFENAGAYVQWQAGQVIRRLELEALDANRRDEFSGAALEAIKPFETGKGLDLEWTVIQCLARA